LSFSFELQRLQFAYRPPIAIANREPPGGGGGIKGGLNRHCCCPGAVFFAAVRCKFEYISIN